MSAYGSDLVWDLELSNLYDASRSYHQQDSLKLWGHFLKKCGFGIWTDPNADANAATVLCVAASSNSSKDVGEAKDFLIDEVKLRWTPRSSTEASWGLTVSGPCARIWLCMKAQSKPLLPIFHRGQRRYVKSSYFDLAAHLAEFRFMFGKMRECPRPDVDFVLDVERGRKMDLLVDFMSSTYVCDLEPPSGESLVCRMGDQKTILPCREWQPAFVNMRPKKGVPLERCYQRYYQEEDCSWTCFWTTELPPVFY